MIQNPIPKTVTSEIWKTIYTSNQLKEAIDYFNDSKLIHKLEPAFNSVKNDFFEPVTKQGIQTLLNQ